MDFCGLHFCLPMNSKNEISFFFNNEKGLLRNQKFLIDCKIMFCESILCFSANKLKNGKNIFLRADEIHSKIAEGLEKHNLQSQRCLKRYQKTHSRQIKIVFYCFVLYAACVNNNTETWCIAYQVRIFLVSVKKALDKHNVFVCEWIKLRVNSRSSTASF